MITFKEGNLYLFWGEKSISSCIAWGEQAIYAQNGKFKKSDCFFLHADQK